MRGPLHGIPIALKDNIHTTDMPTTGGAIAFEGLVPPYDATLTKNLRDAGAVILAKTMLTELANFVDQRHARQLQRAWSATRLNPYDPRRDPRPATGDGRPVLNTGGSSSGIGTAANFWAANVGTETSGSILSPANQNMLAGHQADRRPHQPLRRDSDHRRSGHGRADGQVRSTDAAILLGALEGAAPDPNDAATSTCQAAAEPRLHAVPQARRPEGRAHRHSARELLRPHHACRARRTRAAA